MLEQYLKYDWVWDFDYPDPHKKEHLTIEEFATKLERIYRRQIEKLHSEYSNHLYMLSGGVDSTLCMSYSKDEKVRTISIPNWNKGDVRCTEWMVREFQTDHITLKTQNKITIDDILTMQKFFDHPHARLLALFWYLVAKEMKEQEVECDVVITGAGPDHYMFEDVNSFMIARGLKEKHYDIGLAIRYQKQLEDEFKSRIRMPGELEGEYYEDLFRWNQFPVSFEDEDVEEMGLKPFEWKLRDHTIHHMDNLLCTAKDKTYKLYFKMCESIFGYKFDDSFFTNKNAVRLYNKIPIEAKNCLGYSKPIIRKVASKDLHVGISARTKYDWNPEVTDDKVLVGDDYFHYPIAIDSIQELKDRFLVDKSAKIYDYLDYKSVQKYLKSYGQKKNISSKLWNLINLSAWLEVHE